LHEKNRGTSGQEKVYAAPVWTGHADFCNPFEFATFLRTASGLEFDVMLEAKAKDLALMLSPREQTKRRRSAKTEMGQKPTIAPYWSVLTRLNGRCDNELGPWLMIDNFDTGAELIH
jgi:hypothetical protein